MKIKSKITSKGQVTIPKAVRDELGVQDGDSIVFNIENNQILIEKSDFPAVGLQVQLFFSYLKSDIQDNIVILKGGMGHGKTTLLVGLTKMLVSENKSVFVLDYTNDLQNTIIEGGWIQGVNFSRDHTILTKLDIAYDYIVIDGLINIDLLTTIKELQPASKIICSTQEITETELVNIKPVTLFTIEKFLLHDLEIIS